MSARWTIPQACLWIAERCDENANRLAPGATMAEAVLDVSDAATAADGTLPPRAGAVSGARLKLLEALKAGDLVATGRRNRLGDTEHIPFEKWPGLKLYDNRPGQGCYAGPRDFDPTATTWDQLTLASEDVRRLWRDSSQDQRRVTMADVPPMTIHLSESVALLPPTLVTVVDQTPTPSSTGHHSYAERSAGRKPTKKEAALAWITRKHPQGIPPDLKNSALVDDMAADGVRVNERTLRRALGRK